MLHDVLHVHNGMCNKVSIIRIKKLPDKIVWGLWLCVKSPKIKNFPRGTKTNHHTKITIVKCKQRTAERQIEKRVGAGMSPCFTPLSTDNCSDSWPLKLTWAFILRLSCLNWSTKLGGHPNLPKVFHGASRLTVSNALVRSTKTCYEGIRCSIHVSWGCLAVKIISTVPLPERKPHCASGMTSGHTILNIYVIYIFIYLYIYLSVCLYIYISYVTYHIWFICDILHIWYIIPDVCILYIIYYVYIHQEKPLINSISTFRSPAPFSTVCLLKVFLKNMLILYWLIKKSVLYHIFGHCCSFLLAFLP